MIPAQYRTSFHNAALFLFWAALLVILVVATMPSDEAPDPTGWDKANHALAFYVLTLLAALGYPHRSLVWIALMLCGFGVLIEGLQTIPMLGRSAEWDDLLADTAGVLIGIIPMVMERLRHPLATAAQS